jgi:drug/metabolite transporter (DMT)-like permease
MGAKEWALLVTLSVLWGGSFFFTGIALRSFPPLTTVALRVAGAAAVLLIVTSIMGLRLPRTREAWLAFLGMSVLNNIIPFTLIVWGQTQIASGLAAILNATTPLFTVLAAHLFTADEKITGSKLLGIFVGLAGVTVLVGPDALLGTGEHLVPQLGILAAAMSYALAGIFGRRFNRMGIAPLVTATGQLTTAAMVLIPIALLADQPWHLPAPSVAAWGAIVGTAVLSTAIGYVIFYRLLATAGATNLLLVTFLIPITAVTTGTLLLGEHLDATVFAGMALIGLGLVAIDGRLLRLRKASRSPG